MAMLNNQRVTCQETRQFSFKKTSAVSSNQLRLEYTQGRRVEGFIAAFLFFLGSSRHQKKIGEVYEKFQFLTCFNIGLPSGELTFCYGKIHHF